MLFQLYLFIVSPEAKQSRSNFDLLCFPFFIPVKKAEDDEIIVTAPHSHVTTMPPNLTFSFLTLISLYHYHCTAYMVAVLKLLLGLLGDGKERTCAWDLTLL